MRLSDHAGPLEVPGGLSFGLLLFGFALEGEGLLKLLGNMERIEAARSSDHRLDGNHIDSQPITSGKYYIYTLDNICNSFMYVQITFKHLKCCNVK